MGINTDYQIIEAIVTDIRALVSAPVYDSIPFAPNIEAAKKFFEVTIESVNMMYFWVVTLNGITPEPFATKTQHELLPIRVEAFMSDTEKPGVQNSTDPKQADAFVTGTSTSGSTTTLTDTSKSFTIDQYEHAFELWVTYADGSIRHRRILSNTSDTLTVRKAFDTTIAASLSYEIWLRPTYWVLREDVRSVLNQLATNRSLSGLAVTGSLPAVAIEPGNLYESLWWRATFELTKTQQVAHTYV